MATMHNTLDMDKSPRPCLGRVSFSGCWSAGLTAAIAATAPAAAAATATATATAIITTTTTSMIGNSSFFHINQTTMFSM